MAQIIIKGRKDPIVVDNDTAKRVKSRWCGDPTTGAGKAQKDDILDLGEWAGEYGAIRSIELDRFIPPPKTRPVEYGNGMNRTIKMVPMNYQLQDGERFV